MLVGKLTHPVWGLDVILRQLQGHVECRWKKSECQRWQNRSSPVNPFRKFSNLLFSFFVSQYEAERSKSFVTKNTF